MNHAASCFNLLLLGSEFGNENVYYYISSISTNL